MEFGWRDYTASKGGESGARAAFELDCKMLVSKLHPDKHVDTIRANPGDDGVDIYAGSIGQEPVIIYQCKYFLDEFGESQKSQVRDSFKTAITARTYQVKQWYLLLPYHEFDMAQSLWLEQWKKKQCVEYGLDTDFIKVINGNELMHLLKLNNLYETVFNVKHLLQIEETNNLVKNISNHLFSTPPSYSSNNDRVEYDINLIKNIFNIAYNHKYEEYYVEREIDSYLKFYLKYHKNIWIFGESGCGKTTTMTRTLTTESYSFHYCYLTSVISANSVNTIFDEIVSDTIEKFNIVISESILKSDNVVKKLVQVLNKVNSIGNRPIIYIDELSFSGEEVFLDFVNSIIALSRNYTESNQGEKEIKFVISTIQNPKNFCSNRAKAFENFQFIEVELWNNNELELLLNNVTVKLNIHIDKKEINQILNFVKGSPRKLKNILFAKVTDQNKSFDSIINFFKLEGN